MREDHAEVEGFKITLKRIIS